MNEDNVNQNNKTCIIICNGPSVSHFNQVRKQFDLKNCDIIAVNRWANVFKQLKLDEYTPSDVIVGKNSLYDNIRNITTMSDTMFHGFNNIRRDNYTKLQFGVSKCYLNCNDTIYFNMIGSLWWSGIYAIQLALKRNYSRIHVFGFTCTNEPDAWDNMRRANIPKTNLNRIQMFFHTMKRAGLLSRITFYENSPHILSKYIM